MTWPAPPPDGRHIRCARDGKWVFVLRGAGRGTDEIDRLRQWKREALTVIDAWEAVWEAAGRPGRLGQSKAEAMLEWVRVQTGTSGRAS